MVKSLIARLTVICLAWTLAGCASTGLFSKIAFHKTDPTNPPVRILGLWQAGEGPGVQHGTSRGFSGQIMFFTRTGNEPVEVDGAVQILVFDDQGSAEEQAKPFHDFKFSPGAWKAHLFKGPLGTTYDVFIPYTRPGINEARCTVYVKYLSKEGAEVTSEMVDITLPGLKKPKSGSGSKDHSGTLENESESGAESTDSETAGLARKVPPRARTMSQAMPTSEEIQKMLNRKPAAEELTSAERRRIMREATDRLKSENRSGVTLAGFEEPADGRTNTIQRTGGRQSSDPLADDPSVELDDQRLDDQRIESARPAPVKKGRNLLE